MRILVVEDDPGIGEALRRGLSADGHVVDVEANGHAGVFAANDFLYDVVILDIMLPGLNGYDVLKAIRARENWVPVLMLSSKDGEYDQEDALVSALTTIWSSPAAWSSSRHICARWHAGSPRNALPCSPWETWSSIPARIASPKPEPRST